MAKTITLRVADETYEKLLAAAKSERRSLSNMIETLALKKLDEEYLSTRSRWMKFWPTRNS